MSARNGVVCRKGDYKDALNSGITTASATMSSFRARFYVCAPSADNAEAGSKCMLVSELPVVTFSSSEEAEHKQ